VVLNETASKRFRQTPLRLPGAKSRMITRLKLGSGGQTIRRPAIAPEPPVPFLRGVYRIETPDQRKSRRRAELDSRHRLPPPAPIPLRVNPPVGKRRDDGYNMVVPRLYEGRVAVVFATGPSLTEEVVETIRPYHEDGTVVALGCNDAYRIVPYLDVHYACDPPWWEHHVKHEGIMEHSAKKWTQETGVADKYGVNLINGVSSNGLSKQQNLIHFGGNSGYQVLNLALLYGCSRFILCGYNMSVPPGKPQHFFGMHPAPLSRGTSFGTFVNSYTTIQQEIRKLITNCTPESALKMFGKIRDLKEVLEECRAELPLENIK